MKLSELLIALYFMGCCRLTTTTQPSTKLRDGTLLLGVLETFDSDYLGVYEEIEAYYGIPYAEPPVGSLRFKPPTPLKKIESPFNATSIGNSCPQLDPGISFDMSNKNQSEDCLFLDVFVPTPKQTNVAVLVWIHGGGYLYGAGQMIMMSSLPLTSFGDIILVTLNYRLGPFGFMTTGDDLIPGNLGLRDQQFALKWVQENIEAFGGDPSQVTIVGESAGSASVGYHILSPGSRGYFRSAIMESGSPINHSWMNNFTPEYYRQEVKTLAKLVGCSPEDIANDQTMLNCLQQASAQDILEKHIAAQQKLGVSPLLPVAPVVDGDFLPKDPLRLLQDGAINVENLITGTNAQEGTIQTSITFFPDRQEKPYMNSTMFDVTMSFLGIDHPLLQQLIKLIYTPDPRHLEFDERDYFTEVTQVYGDHVFFCGESKFARIVSSFATTYRYTMKFIPSNNFMGLTWAGAGHADELQYVFGSPFQDKLLFNKTTDAEREMSKKIMTYWSNFVKTGNPNNDKDAGLPEWPIFSAKNEIYKDLSPGMNENVHMKRRECHLLQNIVPSLKETLDELEKLKMEQHSTSKWSEKEQCKDGECHKEPDIP